MSTIEIIGLVLGSSVISALIGGLFSRRKNNADATKAVTEAVNNILQPLNERVAELERKVDEFEKKFTDWLRGIKRLVKQITDLGHKPVWLPDELKEEK